MAAKVILQRASELFRTPCANGFCMTSGAGQLQSHVVVLEEFAVSDDMVPKYMFIGLNFEGV